MIDKINSFRQSPLNFASYRIVGEKPKRKECDINIEEILNPSEDSMPFVYAQMYYNTAQELGISPEEAFEQATVPYLCYNGNI